MDLSLRRGLIVPASEVEPLLDDPEYNRRKELSFKQAEGLSPLPTILSPRTVSPDFRRMFLYLIKVILDERYDRNSSRYPHHGLFFHIWLRKFGQWHHNFPESHWDLMAYMDRWMPDASDVDVLDVFQAFARADLSEDELDLAKKVVENERLAYVLVGDTENNGHTPTLFPRITDQQTKLLTADLAIVEAGAPAGAARHLRRAAELLQEGKRKESVRESISAVEATARGLGPDSKAPLGKALDAIARNHPLHPALRDGFQKLYGWTNDAEGIRHASIEDGSDVSDSLAIFMLSSCAAFCAFLTHELGSPRS